VSRQSSSGNNLGSVRSGSIRRQSFRGVTLCLENDLDYDACMESKEAVAAMLEFAESEMSDENIRFWMEVRDFNETVASGVLEKTVKSIGGRIIDMYLCSTAESQVNLPNDLLRKFAAKAAEGEYHYSGSMFNEASAEIYKMMRTDTFMRFKVSDAAEELVWNSPQLAIKDTKKVYMDRESQRQLRDILAKIQDVMAVERCTAWLVNGRKVFSVAGTNLGNAIVEIPIGTGLVGSAAANGSVLCVDDAYDDPTFDRGVDVKTGFRTRSVLCVPLMREEEEVAVVVQMLNKIGMDKKPALFSAQDALKVRGEFERELIDMCDAIALASMSKALQKVGIESIASIDEAQA